MLNRACCLANERCVTGGHGELTKRQKAETEKINIIHFEIAWIHRYTLVTTVDLWAWAAGRYALAPRNQADN